VNSGNLQEQLGALGRLTGAFWAARDVLSRAVEAAGDEVPQELKQTATHFNAGYVLLIATVHSIMDTAQDSTKPQLFRIFTQLLEADPALEQLVRYFKDVRSDSNLTTKGIAVRTLFNKFCSEATHPTIYGERVSAIVQSMLIRELRQLMEQDTQYLAPLLVVLFEEKMRSEVNTALNGDGKPQPVLKALRRCLSETRGLMDAVVAFLCDSDGEAEEGVSNPGTACEVMLSVGCLLPGTRLADRLMELLQASLPAYLALPFLSAIKFSCHLEESDQRVDPGWVVEYGIWLLPQLTEEQKRRMVGEVFAPLDNNFVEYLSFKPDEWLKMGPDLREQCIQVVLAPRLEREGRAVTAEINPTAGRTVAAALLVHIAPPMSIDLDTSGSATAASVTDEGRNRELELAPSAPVLPDVCLRWLVQNSERCDSSPEQCTELVRYIVEQAGGFDSLGLAAGAETSLLRRGGFPTLQLLAERQNEKRRLAKLLGDYAPTELEFAVIQGVFKDQYIDALRSLINSRASTVEARVKLEQTKMGLQEKVDASANQRRQVATLSQQILVLTAFLNDHAPYIQAKDALDEATVKLTAAEQSFDSVSKLNRQYIIDPVKRDMRDRLPNVIEKLKVTIREINQIRFDISDAVGVQLTDRESEEIMFGQFHAMQDMLRFLQSPLGKVDSAIEEVQAGINEFDSDILSITEQILALYPLVRYACQSSALRDLDPSKFSLQDEDTGTTDLLGVMCRVNLVLARQTAQPWDARSKGLNDAMLIDLGKDISRALQSAFRDKAQQAQSFAVLTDLADLAGASCPLLSTWEECNASRNGVKYTAKSLQAVVSLTELLFRNLHYELSADTIAWGVGIRAGWHESFHGPVIRLFASLTRHTGAVDLVRKRSLAVAMDGITTEVKRHEESAKASVEDASKPDTERRVVASNLVPIPDLLRAWTDILKSTLGIPGGSDEAKESRKQQFQSITQQLAVRANEILAAASQAELDCCFIPAGKAILSASKNPRSALNPLPEDCKPFFFSLKTAIESRNSAQEQATGPPPNQGNTSGVTGLDYSVGAIFRSLTLPAATTIRSRRGTANAE